MITYTSTRPISQKEFIDVLVRSGLAERRPVDDLNCMDAMLKYSNLLCTAWSGDLLVGVARSVTDFAYCCYLSDLAVDRSFQRQSIGKQLIRLTQNQLGPRAKITLLAAPLAQDYYAKVGFERHGSAWVLGAGEWK